MHGAGWEPFHKLARWYDLAPVPTHPKKIRAHTGNTPGLMLDLGGGTARFSARMFPAGSRIVVLDASLPMLQRAKAKRRPVRPVEALADRLPFGDRAFDAIVITEAFHHFADAQQRCLVECARVLKPDGVLVIEEIDISRWPGRFMARGEHAQKHGSVFRRPLALKGLVSASFNEVKLEKSSWLSLIVVARRPRV